MSENQSLLEKVTKTLNAVTALKQGKPTEEVKEDNKETETDDTAVGGGETVIGEGEPKTETKSEEVEAEKAEDAQAEEKEVLVRPGHHESERDLQDLLA
jgi:hypothetical protein